MQFWGAEHVNSISKALQDKNKSYMNTAFSRWLPSLLVLMGPLNQKGNGTYLKRYSTGYLPFTTTWYIVSMVWCVDLYDDSVYFMLLTPIIIVVKKLEPCIFAFKGAHETRNPVVSEPVSFGKVTEMWAACNVVRYRVPPAIERNATFLKMQKPSALSYGTLWHCFFLENPQR